MGDAWMEAFRMRDGTRLEHDGGEVELETRYKGAEPRITRPLDPRLVDIITQPMSVSNLIERMKHDEIDLQPDFQRSKDLWDATKQSRLIESLIIRIPLQPSISTPLMTIAGLSWTACSASRPYSDLR